MKDMDGIAKGMKVVGEKYGKGKSFLAELIVAGETMEEDMKVLEPYPKDGEVKGR